MTLSTRETGKAIYLGGRKGRRENVFSWLSSQLGFGSSGQTTKPAPRASVPRSGPCAPYTFRPCKHISRSAQHCPWGRKLPECISTTAGRHAGVTQPRAPGTSHGRAMLGSPSQGHLAPPMGVPCWGHPAEGTWHLPWTCHAGVTQLRAPGTSHGPLAKSGRQSPGLQKTEAESTASSGRRKQTATGGLCRQLMGRPALGLPRLKMPVGAPRPQL